MSHNDENIYAALRKRNTIIRIRDKVYEKWNNCDVEAANTSDFYFMRSLKTCTIAYKIRTIKK